MCLDLLHHCSFNCVWATFLCFFNFFNRTSLQYSLPGFVFDTGVTSEICYFQSLTSADLSQLGIPEELSPQNVNRLWNRFAAVMQERDMALQAEIVRLVNGGFVLHIYPITFCFACVGLLVCGSVAMYVDLLMSVCSFYFSGWTQEVHLELGEIVHMQPASTNLSGTASGARLCHIAQVVIIESIILIQRSGYNKHLLRFCFAKHITVGAFINTYPSITIQFFSLELRCLKQSM